MYKMRNAIPAIFLQEMLDDEEQMPQSDYRIVWHRDNVTYIATPDNVFNMLPEDIQPSDPLELWEDVEETDI